VCFVVRKTISELDCVILTTLFLSVQKTLTSLQLGQCREGETDLSDMPYSNSCSQHTSSISHSFLVQEPDFYPTWLLDFVKKPMARASLTPHMWLIGMDLGLMLRVCLATSRETLGISTGLYAKMFLMHRRKSIRLPSYLGLKPALT
jgi:hypothetical protein